jgi:hypothetical protein
MLVLAVGWNYGHANQRTQPNKTQQMKLMIPSHFTC